MPSLCSQQLPARILLRGCGRGVVAVIALWALLSQTALAQSNWRLLGTMVSSDPSHSSALILLDEQLPVTLRAGQSLSPNAYLQAVHVDRVLIRQGTQSITLRLHSSRQMHQQNITSAPHTPPAPAPAPQMPLCSPEALSRLTAEQREEIETLGLCSP